jgi:hypothetical protein
MIKSTSRASPVQNVFDWVDDDESVRSYWCNICIRAHFHTLAASKLWADDTLCTPAIRRTLTPRWNQLQTLLQSKTGSKQLVHEIGALALAISVAIRSQSMDHVRPSSEPDAGVLHELRHG